MSFTVHVWLTGERGTETHAVDVLGTDTLKEVRGKAAAALQVETRSLTLFHDGEALDDLCLEVTRTTLVEGSEVEARLPAPITVDVEALSNSQRVREVSAALEASPGTPLHVDVCGVQGTLDLPLPWRVEHLVLVDSDPTNTHITAVGDQFLRWHAGLETVDLSLLSEVTTIGGSFLGGCSALKALDLAPLTNVTLVGDLFLYGCTALGGLDLAPLANLTAVGCWFLYGCGALEELDLSPLSGVESIGRSFLVRCGSLKVRSPPPGIVPHVPEECFASD